MPRNMIDREYLKERWREKTVAEWAAEFGVSRNAILRAAREMGIRGARARKDTLCWECGRSAAPPGVQCAWDRALKPVKGWDAKRVMMLYEYTNERSVESYRVRGCPLFLEVNR